MFLFLHVKRFRARFVVVAVDGHAAAEEAVQRRVAGERLALAQVKAALEQNFDYFRRARILDYVEHSVDVFVDVMLKVEHGAAQCAIEAVFVLTMGCLGGSLTEVGRFVQ